MGAGCNTSGCRYKCHEEFDEDDRKDIFNSFEAIGDIIHQKQFGTLASLLNKTPVS